MKLYRDHIDILLSEMGYSELVQRLFEKMTFFLVDPLIPVFHQHHGAIWLVDTLLLSHKFYEEIPHELG
jgi:hypothetical protein